MCGTDSRLGTGRQLLRQRPLALLRPGFLGIQDRLDDRECSRIPPFQRGLDPNPTAPTAILDDRS